MKELSKRIGSIPDSNSRTEYYKLWNEIHQIGKQKFDKFITDLKFSEFKAVDYVISQIPNNSIIHLANSMVVRYANIVGLPENRNIEVFANRGTSGIDGSFSSAVGNALFSDKLVILMIGDLSFFYDRNAVWNNLKLSNLRIILFNNGGGNIFRIIDGPGKLPEVKDFFETEQQLCAEYFCKESNIDYTSVNDLERLFTIFDNFFQISNRPKLIEIKVNGDENVDIFNDFKQIFI